MILILMLINEMTGIRTFQGMMILLGRKVLFLRSHGEGDCLSTSRLELVDPTFLRYFELTSTPSSLTHTPSINCDNFSDASKPPILCYSWLLIISLTKHLSLLKIQDLTIEVMIQER